METNSEQERAVTEVTEQRSTRRNGLRGLLLAALAVALLTALVAPAGAHNKQVERTDVLGQGGEGILAEDGAKLVRDHGRLKVKWKVPTPAPGSYAYPTADMIPPGAPPHPEIVPGAPEVFTLWAFVFNYPGKCNGPCDFDDIGDTPAQGGVFQLDATVAHCKRIKMQGTIRTGDTPVDGASLQAPKRAEVHVAMAPHGKALTGADLQRQMTGGVGGPPLWFPALFV